MAHNGKQFGIPMSPDSVAPFGVSGYRRAENAISVPCVQGSHYSARLVPPNLNVDQRPQVAHTRRRSQNKGNTYVPLDECLEPRPGYYSGDHHSLLSNLLPYPQVAPMQPYQAYPYGYLGHPPGPHEAPHLQHCPHSGHMLPFANALLYQNQGRDGFHAPVAVEHEAGTPIFGDYDLLGLESPDKLPYVNVGQPSQAPSRAKPPQPSSNNQARTPGPRSSIRLPVATFGGNSGTAPHYIYTTFPKEFIKKPVDWPAGGDVCVKKEGDWNDNSLDLSRAPQRTEFALHWEESREERGLDSAQAEEKLNDTIRVLARKQKRIEKWLTGIYGTTQSSKIAEMKLKILDQPAKVDVEVTEAELMGEPHRALMEAWTVVKARKEKREAMEPSDPLQGLDMLMPQFKDSVW